MSIVSILTFVKYFNSKSHSKLKSIDEYRLFGKDSVFTPTVVKLFKGFFFARHSKWLKAFHDAVPYIPLIASFLA